jgi:AAA15 family ATPase/GTPase
MLNLQNIKKVKKKLEDCDVLRFEGIGNSYRNFLKKIEVKQFRHLSNVPISFEHPVTIITGTNKIGKTSILLLIACSHENFCKMDSTSPEVGMRSHVWRDVLSFTKYENTNTNYSYKLKWRVGNSNREGEGKRLSSSRSWSGLGKRSSNDSRINAKIRERHVRFIDLERVLPVRNFSYSL